MKLGFQPVNIAGQFYGNVVHPINGSPWGMRLQLAFLFPKLTKDQEKLTFLVKSTFDFEASVADATKVR